MTFIQIANRKKMKVLFEIDIETKKTNAVIYCNGEPIIKRSLVFSKSKDADHSIKVERKPKQITFEKLNIFNYKELL